MGAQQSERTPTRWQNVTYSGNVAHAQLRRRHVLALVSEDDMVPDKITETITEETCWHYERVSAYIEM